MYSQTETASAYEGGTGTEEDPFQIATLAQLKRLSETSGDWGDHFVLTADIDASDTKNWNEVGGTVLGFSPIGNHSVPFKYASFDGQGHTISNLYINREGTAYVGLFGEIRYSSISKLHLVNAEVHGADKTGALVGLGIYDNVIDSCSVDAAVSGKSQVGGLIGYSWAESRISNSYSLGSVSGTGNSVGGLCGYNDNQSVIELCFSAAEVTGLLGQVGGLCGFHYNKSIIRNCFATGSVLCGDEVDAVGGFVGRAKMSAKIINSYAIGAVSGKSAVGAFMGVNESGCVITDCYVDSDKANVAELVGDDQNSQLVKTLTTSGFAQKDNFTNWGFDADVWKITLSEHSDSVARPFLGWMPTKMMVKFFAGENGTVEGAVSQLLEVGETSQTVTAVPDEGCRFVEWQNATGDKVGAELLFSIQYDDVDAYYAVFEKEGSTAVDELHGFTMYPVPACNELRIIASGSGRVSIYNTLGIKVIEESINGETDLDLTYLTGGLYTAKATINGKTIVEKLLIVK